MASRARARHHRRHACHPRRDRRPERSAVAHVRRAPGGRVASQADADRQAHARDGGPEAPEVRGELRALQRRAEEPARGRHRRRSAGARRRDREGCAAREQGRGREACTEARAAARESAAARDPARARAHDVRLRVRTQAHWRGRRREARLHAGRVYGGAPRARQVGVREVPDAHPGAGSRARDRQRNPDRGAARARAGREVRRSPAAVSAGRHLRAGRARDPALDAGAVGGQHGRGAAAPCRGDAPRPHEPHRAACRRDAGLDA